MDHTIFINESLRRMEESRQRIHHCVSLLDHDRLWTRPNANLVSVGDLILHLSGNVGQWINASLGGAKDDRDRRSEFAVKDGIEADRLLERLDATLEKARIVVQGMSSEALDKTYRVQGFSETGTAIILHVVEHLSYHTGQIALHTKLFTDSDLGFYRGSDLDVRS